MQGAHVMALKATAAITQWMHLQYCEELVLSTPQYFERKYAECPRRLTGPRPVRDPQACWEVPQCPKSSQCLYQQNFLANPAENPVRERTGPGRQLIHERTL